MLWTLAFDGDSYFKEILPAKEVGLHQYKICCIPFFIVDVSLGDVVLTSEALEIMEVVEPSNRFTFQMFFIHQKRWSQTLNDIKQAGALIEFYNKEYVAVDAATPEIAERVKGLLDEAEARGEIDYRVATWPSLDAETH